LRDRIFDLDGDLVAGGLAGGNGFGWPDDDLFGAQRAAVQISYIGVVQYIAEAFLEDKIFDIGLAMVLGRDGIGDDIAGFGGCIVSVGQAGRNVSGSFTDSDTGDGVAGANALIARLAVNVVGRKQRIVFANRWRGRSRRRCRRCRDRCRGPARSRR